MSTPDRQPLLSTPEPSSTEEVNVPAPDWASYQGGKFLTAEERKRMEDLNNEDSINGKLEIVMEKVNEYIDVFIKILFGVHQDHPIKYIVNLIDQFMNKSPQFTERFFASNNDTFAPFLRMLSKNDKFIVERCSRILTHLFALDTANTRKAELEAFVDPLVTQLQNPDNAPMAVHGLMDLLRRDEARLLFFKAKGLHYLTTILRANISNIQLCYETCFCIWMLTYNQEVVKQLDAAHLIAQLHDVLKNIQKEKVVRVILAAFKNMLNAKSSVVGTMISLGLPKTLANIAKRKINDEDIVVELKALNETLEHNIVELSSFDEYRQEVLSGHLEWSPAHTSEKFWKENMAKFEQNNYYILRELVKLLQSNDPATLSITCHDLGQFVRYHPRGKRILEELGAKVRVMQLMESEDETVRKHALACTQKFLIKNWEFLQR